MELTTAVDVSCVDVDAGGVSVDWLNLWHRWLSPTNASEGGKKKSYQLNIILIIAEGVAPSDKGALPTLSL
jgi:hypothetical protein